MPIFRVEKNNGYTIMSNHHLRNKELSLKAKGLLSQMLSLPDDWDYTLKGLAFINKEQIDAIREAVKELETAGYIVRSRERDEKGRLRGADYVIYETPQPASDLPTWENPTLDMLVIYGRMIQIYLVTSLGPIPLSTMANGEWRSMGQNYLKSLLALAFQAFLIMVCVGIYAVLIQSIGTGGDISGAIWRAMGYTVLLCFCLFKTGSISNAVFGAH